MSALLEVQGVSVRFGGLRALNDVSCSLEEGRVLGIMGPNGAGKTTLFNIISGFIRADQGKVLFAGQDMTGCRPHAFCKLGMARTFQIAKPFPELTILDSVRIGALNRSASMRDATEKAEAVLQQVGLAEKAYQLGKQLTTIERKKLEVGRAIATEPRLLLLDEVAAGLRPSEVKIIVQLIKKIAASGVAVLMIEHVMEALLSVSDRIIMLNYGELLAEGTPMDIVHNPLVMDAYLGTERAHA